MLLATNTGAGQNMGFPDTCNTPTPPTTTPIPYPNIAMHAQATPFSSLVRVSGLNALNQTSKISMTSGMEAGVAHPSLKMQGGFATGNPIVKVEGSPGICLACPTNGNNMNNSVGAVAVPSVTTVFYTLRPQELSAPPAASTDPYGHELDGDQLTDLAATLANDGLRAHLVGGTIGYLGIPLFTTTVSTQVFRALRKLGGDLDGLVLDLRNNPGGDNEAMGQLADDFLARDATILREVDDEGDERVVRARQTDPYPVAVVVLVNGGTASAAELFAGCLQQHGRAKVVGETTYGKGRAQRIVADVDGYGVWYASVARCLLPDGSEIEGRGIEPDVVVADDDPSGDRQLAAALSELGYSE